MAVAVAVAEVETVGEGVDVEGSVGLGEVVGLGDCVSVGLGADADGSGELVTVTSAARRLTATGLEVAGLEVAAHGSFTTPAKEVTVGRPTQIRAPESATPIPALIPRRTLAGVPVVEAIVISSHAWRPGRHAHVLVRREGFVRSSQRIREFRREPSGPPERHIQLLRYCSTMVLAFSRIRFTYCSVSGYGGIPPCSRTAPCPAL